MLGLGKREDPDKVRRELYCESHDVKVQLSNLDKHPYPCTLRVGVRVRCKTHGVVINAAEVEGAHAKCEIGPYKVN